jgi:hypothetical protein
VISKLTWLRAPSSNLSELDAAAKAAALSSWPSASSKAKLAHDLDRMRVRRGVIGHDNLLQEAAQRFRCRDLRLGRGERLGAILDVAPVELADARIARTRPSAPSCSTGEKPSRNRRGSSLPRTCPFQPVDLPRRPDAPIPPTHMIATWLTSESIGQLTPYEREASGQTTLALRQVKVEVPEDDEPEDQCRET